MESIFRALGQFVVRFKYPVAIAWIVITIFSVRAFPSLGSVTKVRHATARPAQC